MTLDAAQGTSRLARDSNGARIRWDRELWVLGPALDILIVLVPMAYMVVGWVFASRGMLQPGSLAPAVLISISEFLLGNAGHIGLTYLLLFSNRAMRDALPDGARRTLLVNAAILAFGVAAVLGACLAFEDPARGMRYLTAFVLVFGFHHNLMQCRGFWALYDMRLRRTVDVDASKPRRLFEILCAYVAILAWITFVFAEGRVGASTFTLPRWFMVASGLGALGLGGALAVQLFGQRFVSGPQLLYLVRMCVYGAALMEGPSLVFVGLAAAHGIEYIAIVTRVTRRRQSDEIGTWAKLIRNRLVFAGAVLLFLLPGAAAELWRHANRYTPLGADLSSLASSSTIVVAFWCLWCSLSLSHYYLDGRMFRFRLPRLRDALLPYLR